MAERTATLPRLTEIKHPFAHLSTDTPATCVFFEVDDMIVSWDDLTGNYPRWAICVHTKEEALERIRDMVESEGWNLWETTEDELKDLL